MVMGEEGEQKLSIYRAWRWIKRRDSSLYNALCSIYSDSVFVTEIAHLWPRLPLLANLRCGRWYSSSFNSTCYFKSTDGHSGNWSFSTARLNLHVATLAGQRCGCIIVDSTRKGKRFPDSMSKTIPIWACVLNRAIRNRLRRMADCGKEKDGNLETLVLSDGTFDNTVQFLLDWDTSLHLPLWVSIAERIAIEERLDEWAKQLEDSGADIDSLVSSLRKPLRPLWISQKTVIWLNEVPANDSWDFTPIVLLSASSPTGLVQKSSLSEFSWHYIPGAGDDEECWAKGLTPELFWRHAFDIISWGPDLCNQKVAELVEKDRVYRAQRGENAPQVTAKPRKALENTDDAFRGGHSINVTSLNSGTPIVREITESPNGHSCFWIGSTNVAIGSSSDVFKPAISEEVDCVLNCDSGMIDFHRGANGYLNLSILSSKLDRFSLLNNLPCALDFAKLHLSGGEKLLVCCHSGEDVSVCVCLAILTSLYDGSGVFDGGKTFMESCITKWEMRRRLILICKFAVNARPSRGNLKQVFCYLSRERISDAAIH